MKKNLILLAGAAILLTVSCNVKKSTPLSRSVKDYETVTIKTPSLEGITDNGKEVLNLYRFAADEADKIYWDQYFGDKALMDAVEDESAREFAMINYGPWDRIDGKSFIDGYDVRPAGANFYPSDMTDEEFAAFDDSLKSNPYTLVRRDGNGALKTVWFHDAYKDNIDKICNYLKAAADITIKESVRNYLLKKIDALRTDDYYESDLAWLDMTDSKMDLIIGPNETEDDQLYGTKRSYGAFVLLKQLEKTAQIDQLTSMLPELQKSLPCDDAYKAFVPGNESDIYAYDALYYAGNYNAGIKVIAVNLPYDPRVQAEKGTRTVLLHNVMNEKFNRIVFPIGKLLIDGEQAAHLSDDAFFWNIAFREVAHGLGVKETVNGKGSVADALGSEALPFEEMKGNIVGLYLVCNLMKEHQLSGIVTKEDAITTYLASLLRSERFGTGSALGRANIMIYNYLSKKGAFVRNESGKYHIDYAKAQEAISDLAGEILKIQATGDYQAAKAFETEYAFVSKDFSLDQHNIRLEGIPTDIRFDFEK